MGKRISVSILFGLLVISSMSAQAQILSEAGLFQRCYLQITSTRPKSTDPLLVAVKAGTKKAVDACVEVLQRAQLTANGGQTLPDTSDTVAKSVLATFHRLHASWFYSKDFPVISWNGHNFDIKDLYDSTSPALYFTRALFKPSTPVSNIVTSPDNLIAVRANMDPAAGAATGHTKADFVFTTPFVFAATGELLGVQPVSGVNVSFPSTEARPPITSFDLSKTQGGGLLGSEAYVLLNAGSMSSSSLYKTDGAVKVHRRWGKAVFHDLLCRDLPVLRESDVTALVSPTSTIPFRTSSSCTKCHASQDQVAGVIRGMHVLYVGKGDPTAAGLQQRGGAFADYQTVAKPAETSWPVAPDADYYQRPTNGVLFFRDYMGNLTNQSVSSVNDLGQALAATDDFYICVAKRYYSYFTGIEIDNSDLGDPSHVKKLSDEDLKNRDIVINLGKNLKAHQSLQQLIIEILNLDHYRRVDSGTFGGVNVQ